MNDEQWLRDTLTSPDVAPPPDLAARAERAARGIRRRRVAATALAVAALVVVPVAVQRGTHAPDRTAGPPAPACHGKSYSDTYQSERARSAADAAWPYRGDARLRDRAVAAGTGLADVRPLFGAGLDGGGTVVMVAGRRGTDWRLRYAVTGPSTDSAEQALPALHAGTQLSVVVGPGPAASGPTTTLVVVAAPGTTGIIYRYCEAPDGTPLRHHDVAGDTAVLPLRSADEVPGVLAVRTGARVTERDQPGTGYVGAFATEQLDPIPVPAGYRRIGGTVNQRGQVTYRGDPVVDGRVLVRCWKPMQWEPNPHGDLMRSIRCDGLVQAVAERVSFGPGTVLDTSFSTDKVEVLVVVPDG